MAEVSGREVVVAPFDMYTAPTGTPFPLVHEPPASPWTLFGASGARSMLESGISISRPAQDGIFRGYGAGRARKAWTVSEDFMFSGTFADSTLEHMSKLLEDAQDVVDTAPSGTGFGINAIRVNNAGAGYTGSSVSVTIANANGVTATARAVRDAQTLGSVQMVLNGSGYSSVPAVNITGGGGSGATATAVVQNGQVVRVDVDTPGTGYTGDPTITIAAPTKANAAATAIVTDGRISEVRISNPGNGYGSPPAVTIADAPARGTRATARAVVGAIPGYRTLIIGRRGAALQKREFSFLIRGKASPYVELEVMQFEVPRMIFMGAPNITANRADPITVTFECQALEDDVINGYARMVAVDQAAA